MGFEDYLHAGRRDLGKELSHGCLASGMQMYFRVFDEKHATRFCKQRRYDDGKNLGDAETRVRWPMEVRLVRSPNAQCQGIGTRYRRDFELAARKEGGHASPDLT